jgi:flagellar FliL protein
MSDAESPEEAPAPKKSKKGLLIGLVAAAVLGGGAFYAVFSGMILAPKTEVAKEEGPVLEDTKKATFVELDPIVVSLGRSSSHQLRFNAQLEVEPSKQEDVANLMPRILDVLNGYLRAVDIAELQEPSALIRLRVQMLRRIELVTGEGHVKDLLITEFVFT